MTSINMDKTIEEMLKLYAWYMKILLNREDRSIQRIRNDADRKEAAEQYQAGLDAHEYLQSVARDPKKYLYFPRNMEYTYVDKSGIPVTNMVTGVTVGQRLEPIFILENKYCSSHVLHPLSQNIANHVIVTPEEETMTSEGKVWAYYGRYSYDTNAENILELNKCVHMWASRPYVRFFQQFARPTFFAEPLCPKNSR